jgi:hypothetical protein
MNDPGGESISDSRWVGSSGIRGQSGVGTYASCWRLRKVYMKSSVGWVSAGLAGGMLQTM